MTTELLASDEDDCAHYTNKIDVYSFGVTLVYIVTVNMKNVVNGVLPPLLSTIIYWVRELIISCFSFEVENRPSFDQIFEIMKEKANARS